MYVYLHDLNELYACWNGKERFLCKGNQVSARLAETRFGSRREFRPPNPFCGGSVRLPTVPPKRDFRLCLGLSAAEGAAEPA